MRPTEQHSRVDGVEPSDEGLVWPLPAAENDILWLEPEPDPRGAVADPQLAAAPVASSSPSTSAGAANHLPVAAAPAIVPRESGASFTLAQLVAAGVSMEWHDAVAIVSQLADSVIGDKRRPPIGALPAIGAIRLDAEGGVHVHLDRHGTESLTAGFGRVLQALLHDKPTPANLRLLAWRATSDAGASLTLDEIIGELARWERPGRVGKLQALYERARIAGPPPTSALLFEPVEMQPTDDEQTTARTHAPDRDGAAKSPQQIALVVAGAIVCVAIGSMGAWLFERQGDVPPAPARRVAAAPPPAQARVPDPPVRERPAGRAPRETARPAAPAVPPRAKETAPAAVSQAVAPVAPTPNAAQPRLQPAPGAQSPAISQAPATTASVPAATRPLPPPAGTVATQSAPAPVPIAPPPAPIAPNLQSYKPDSQLYRSGDAGVTEPVLVKPYLPIKAHPPIPDSALGVLEVVVDARGLVESVHLKSPANRYREKWWLFTAKEWQFEPARKNGAPVRFLKRILLTDLNITEPQ